MHLALRLGWSFVIAPRLTLTDPEDLSDVGPTVPVSAQPLDFPVDQPVEPSTLPDEVIELSRIDRCW